MNGWKYIQWHTSSHHQPPCHSHPTSALICGTVYCADKILREEKRSQTIYSINFSKHFNKPYFCHSLHHGWEILQTRKSVANVERQIFPCQPFPPSSWIPFSPRCTPLWTIFYTKDTSHIFQIAHTYHPLDEHGITIRMGVRGKESLRKSRKLTYVHKTYFFRISRRSPLIHIHAEHHHHTSQPCQDKWV